MAVKSFLEKHAKSALQRRNAWHFTGKFVNKFSLKFIEISLLFLIKILYFTCRVNFNDNKLPSRPCVVLFWHGRLAMMAFAFSRFWRKDYGTRMAKVIISDHKDGEIITRIISHFGIGAVRGSSRKNAARALISALREIDNGNDIIITPDGPKGPYRFISDGAVIIAQKKECEICILNYEISRFWQLKSWDKMIIPKPFSRISYFLGDPFRVDGLNLDVAKERIKKKMQECERLNLERI